MEESDQPITQSDSNDQISQKQQLRSQKQAEQFTMRQVNVARLKNKVMIRCVVYMVDDLFALSDDSGQISIYNTVTYELNEFPNKYIQRKISSYSVRFYSNYYTNPKTNESIDVLCQCLLNNMIIFWNITHFIKTKELIAYKVVYTTYDNNYDSVILPDYQLIAVSHQAQRMLAFYYHSNKPYVDQEKKRSKVLLSQQFDQSLFSLQYDRKRKMIYVCLINASVYFYDMKLRQIMQVTIPQVNNRYGFDSLLIPRNISFLNTPEEKINRKMIDEEYDFQYLLVSTDQGLMCINLDYQCVTASIGGHTNQTRSQVYHKQSNSIFTISCDKRIGIHPMQIIKEVNTQITTVDTNPLSVFKETNLRSLCNSLSVNKEDVVVVSWGGEIGHYKYESDDIYESIKLEEFQQLAEQYQTLQKLIKENIYLKSLQQQHQQQNN